MKTPTEKSVSDCPVCGSSSTIYLTEFYDIDGDHNYQVICDVCEVRTALFRDVEDAANAWIVKIKPED